MKVLYFNIIILIFLFSCKKKEIYYDIPENYRLASLYYTYNKGDTFKLIKDSIDTCFFKINYRNVSYNSSAQNRNKNYEFFELKFYDISSDMGGKVDVFFENDKYNLLLQFTNKYDNPILASTNLIDYYASIVINNNNYTNVYSLGNCFISQEKGIIKAWNDSVTFSIIE